MTFDEVDRLVELSRRPLDDAWLEDLAAEYGQHNYYRFLYYLALALRPALALEVGVENGVGSAHMAVAAQTYGGHVAGLDILWRPFPVEILPFKVDNYTFLCTDAAAPWAALRVEALTGRYGPVGLVYQDSSHHYLLSRQEWANFEPLRRGGPLVWVCDDITPAFWNKDSDPPGLGMVQYFEERPGTKKLYPDVLHYGNSMGVILL